MIAVITAKTFWLCFWAGIGCALLGLAVFAGLLIWSLHKFGKEYDRERGLNQSHNEQPSANDN